MLDDVIGEGRKLLEKVRKHYTQDPNTLPTDKQVTVAELEAWYRGVEGLLQQHFGEDSSEVTTWRKGIRESRKQSWDALGRGDKPRGESWVVHLLVESLGTLSEIKLANFLPEKKSTLPSSDHKALADRIAAMEARVAELASYLHSALQYLSSDPQSSLTKSRIILEKLLLALYRGTLKKEPLRPMIGDMLANKAFTAAIPRRIVARMNSIRDMSNLGPHGEVVNNKDAIRVLRDLIDVLEWYVVHYDTSCQLPGKHEAKEFLEILPQLKGKYPQYVRPEIVSVKFVQAVDQCFLEITTTEKVNDYLADETIKRSDLAFIAGGRNCDDRFFSPTSPITVNARHFIEDFDELSIINCTDLFTPEAASKIDDHWREYGYTPDLT